MSSTEFQKHIIEQRLDAEVSLRYIADELHVSKSTILLAKKKLKILGRLHAHQVRVAQKVLPKTKISH